MTYEEMTEQMFDIYINECGYSPDKMGDTAIRLKAAASEIYALQCKNDFALKQAFPQTATGEYLDRHAELLGISRKLPNKSKGQLTFFVSEAAIGDIVIPEGTICSKGDDPYIQVSTDEECVLKSGETRVSTTAQSIAPGNAFNVSQGAITVMVNAPAGVEGVTNDTPFTDGYDGEYDEALRQRVEDAYYFPKNGISIMSLTTTVNEIDGVIDSNIVRTNAGEITVYVKTAMADVNSLKSDIENALGILTFSGAVIDVQKALPFEFSITAEIVFGEGYDFETVKSQVQNTLSKLCAGEKVGGEISASKIIASISKIDGIYSAYAYFNENQSGIISCGANRYPVLTEVNVFERC